MFLIFYSKSSPACFFFFIFNPKSSPVCFFLLLFRPNFCSCFSPFFSIFSKLLFFLFHKLLQPAVFFFYNFPQPSFLFFVCLFRNLLQPSFVFFLFFFVIFSNLPLRLFTFCYWSRLFCLQCIALHCILLFLIGATPSQINPWQVWWLEAALLGWKSGVWNFCTFVEKLNQPRQDNERGNSMQQLWFFGRTRLKCYY